MDKKTQGSWLIHHTSKLQGVTNQFGFEKTFLAGKAGILLSAISANDEISISNDRLNVLATAASINTTFELPKLLEVLQSQELIDRSQRGIAVLGVTTSSALMHTSKIFESLDPRSSEHAAVTLAETASQSPIYANEVGEELSDIYSLSTSDLNQFLNDAETIGFVDVEHVGKNQKLLFNGHLFRRDSTQKIMAVLDSLNSNDRSRLQTLTEVLRKKACMTVDEVKAELGGELFQKVTAIGLFDISIVSNSSEDVGYVTLPSAFSKFSDSMVDDAFDLAKAFVSSITYGMTKSSYTRGNIQMVDALLRALIRGESVGPVPAIGEDYKVLELKGVVKVENGAKNGRWGPMLTLLKKEIGELALQAIQQGDVSEHSLSSFPTATITKFRGPELNRERIRRKQTAINPKATNDMLSILRTGAKIRK